MPDVGELRDTYVIEPVLEDNASPQAAKIAAALGGMEKSAIAAAQAIKDAGTAVQGAAAPVQVASTAFDRMANSIDQQTRAANALTRAEKALTDAVREGQVALAAGKTNVETVSRVTSELASRVDVAKNAFLDIKEANEAAALAGQRWNGTIDAVNTKLGQHSAAANQAAFATRQLGVQSIQFFSSIASGAPVMTAFVQQGHQVVDVALSTGTGFSVLTNAAKSFAGFMAGPTGIAILVGAAVVAITALAASSESAARQQGTLRNELSATRDDFGKLAIDVTNAGKAVAATTSATRAEATAAAQAIASMPTFNPMTQSLTQLTATAEGLAQVLGIKLPEAASKLVEAAAEPGKVATALATAERPLRDLDAATLASILHLEQMGNKAGATQVLMTALGVAAHRSVDDMTPLQTAIAKLGATMDSTSVDGKTFLERMGKPFTDFAAGAVSALDSVIAKLNDLDAKMQKSGGPSLGQAFYNGIAPMLPGALGYRVYQGITGGGTPATPAPLAPGGSVQSGAAGIAAQHLGQGPADVQGFLSGQNIDPIVQAWCAAFANAALAAVGIQGSGSNVATSFANWGQKIEADVIQAGDVLVQAKGAAAGATGGHVGIAVGGPYRVTPSDANPSGMAIDMISGNYSGRVSRSTEPLSSVEARRGVPGVNNMTGQPATTPGGAPPLTQEQLNARSGVLINAESTKEVAAYEQKIRDLSAAQKLGAISDIDAANGIAKLQQLIVEATDKSVGFERAQNNEAAVTGQLGKAAKELAQVRIDARNQALADPQHALSEIQIAGEQAAVQNKLTAEYNDQIRTQDQVIAEHTKMAEAVAKGTGVAVEAQARQEAYNITLNSFTRDSPQFQAAWDKLTSKMVDAKLTTADVTAAQEHMQNAFQSKLLDAETASIGQNADARALLVQHMKDEFDIAQKYAGKSPEFQQARLAERDALAAQNQQLQIMTSTANYLSGQFDQAFSNIGQAITQAFVQGQGAAVNWGNVTKGIIAQVAQAFLQLAIINPVKQILFGTSATQSPTLSNVFSLFEGGSSVVSAAGGGGAGSTGLLGSLFGGGGTSGVGAAATAAAAAAAFSGSGTGGKESLLTSLYGYLSNGSTLYSSANTLSGGGIGNYLGLSGKGSILQNLGGQFSGTGFFGSGGYVSNLLATPIFGSVSGAATNTAIAAELGGAQGPATAAAYTAAGGYVPTTLGAVTSVVGGVAAGYGLGSLAGGFVQGGLNKTGPAPQIGAATGAIAGAIIGSIFPVIGTTIGAIAGGLIGGLGGGLIGPHTPTPFSSQRINTSSTGLSLGDTLSQGVNPYPQVDAANAGIAAINQVLSLTGTQYQGIYRPGDLSANNFSAAGSSFQLGTQLGGADKFSDFSTAFPRMRFTSQDQATATGVENRSFADVQDLGKFAGSIKDLETALASTDAATNINRWVEAFRNLGTDSFVTEMQTIAGFVTVTIPQLMKFGDVAGSYNDAISSISATFAPAIAMAQQLGYKEADLTAQRQKSYDAAQAAAYLPFRNQYEGNIASVMGINAQIGNDPQAAFQAQQYAKSVSDREAMDQLKSQIEATYGTAALGGTWAQSQYDNLNQLQGAQSELMQKQFYDTWNNNVKNIANQNITLEQRRLTAQETVTNASPASRQADALHIFDEQAQQQRQAMTDQLTQMFGDSIKTQQFYADEMTSLEATLAQERLAILTQFTDQAKQAATGQVNTLVNFARSLALGGDSPLSPKAKLDLAQSEFNSVSAAAAGGDAGSIGKLTDFSQNLITAARDFYGSGTDFVTIFNQVTDALNAVGTMTSDQLTASFMADQLQGQTATLVDELQALRDEVVRLRTSVEQGSLAPARLAA